MTQDAIAELARENLEPCPFCGKPLFIPNFKVNPYGRCETEGCWMNARDATVVLEDARQVQQWNTRALHAAGYSRAPVGGWQDVASAPDNTRCVGYFSIFEGRPTYVFGRVSNGVFENYLGQYKPIQRVFVIPPDDGTATTPARDDVRAARTQGLNEGFAAAVQQLRCMSAQKPNPPLTHEASILADSLERSRIPARAMKGEGK